MKLDKPELEFDHDENDPDDLGGWSVTWGEFRIRLTSDYADANKRYIYLRRDTGDDDETASIYMDGSIQLGAYGIQTSFHDLHKCLSIRKAVRLLNSVR